jgi:predicted HicB family RNase H-like nuclease
MMEYKGYFAKVEFDDEADIFHGEVINLRDVVTFQGQTVDELHKAFRDSIDDYLHKTIALKARQDGTSLNSWVHDTLAKAAG